MKAGGGFQRQGRFPAEKPALAQALALLEQRAADKFDALDRNGGDVVGDWIQLNDIALGLAQLGNGRITGKWRKVGNNNAGFRLLLEVGTTTAFGPFGFELRPPAGYAFNPDQALFTLKSNATFPVTMSGTLAGVANTGKVTPAVMTTAGQVLILGTGISTLAAADYATLEVEIPVKRAL